MYTCLILAYQSKWASSSVSCILESVEWNLALESVHVQLKWSDSYVHRLLMQQICSLCWIAILTRRYIFKLWYIKILNVASLHCVLQSTGAASYSKFVSREMSKAEALLKVNGGEYCNDCWKRTVLNDYHQIVSSWWHNFMQVILSPVDSVANTYRALLPEGTPLEFQRILDLKVFYIKIWPVLFANFYLPG